MYKSTNKVFYVYFFVIKFSVLKIQFKFGIKYKFKYTYTAINNYVKMTILPKILISIWIN